MNRVRVLVVANSPTIQRLLTAALLPDPDIEVVGSAPEPSIACQEIRDLNPDVITLAVDMPDMTGLEFLEKIMRLRPMPVVMVSMLTERGADLTLRALEIGAVDYHAMPTENFAAAINIGGFELCAKIKAAARANVQARKRPNPPGQTHSNYRPNGRIVAIGTSTGGVGALIQVLSHFPANCPPTVIIQHMPPCFTARFAQMLDNLCEPHVKEASDEAPLQNGTIYLAPGGNKHLEVTGRGAPRCRLRAAPSLNGHCSSVDLLFHSVAEVAGTRSVGVLLTGIGRDGALGLKMMRDVGSATIGQDKSSSVIYGMSQAAFEANAVERQLPLFRIGPELVRLCEAVSEDAKCS